MELAAQQIAFEPPTATDDQECWVRERILAAIRMGLAVSREKRVGADGPAFDGALRGISEGAAEEVIRTMGFNVPYINLPPYSGREDVKNKASSKINGAPSLGAN